MDAPVRVVNFTFRFLTVLLVYVIAPWATYAAQPSNVPPAVPFIEIDPGTTTQFRERGTHRPFVAIGVNYFDPQVGWAPQLWKRFDESRVRRHLDLIHQAGFNTIRVFLSYGSFQSQRGRLDPDGMKKFGTLLSLCRERGIYVIPTGADAWEGVPAWRTADRFADEAMLDADDEWWRAFAGGMRDEPAILAYDLLNEPAILWDSPALRSGWKKYVTSHERTTAPAAQDIPAPQPPTDPARARRLLAYQHFREAVGENWTRRKVAAIRAVDPNHLITIGHIQWAAPILLPSIAHYAGFDLETNSKWLDFTTIHFYPLDAPKPCDSPDGIRVNAAYLGAVLFQATAGKPLMLGEFGWHGGGAIRRGEQVDLAAQTPQDQLNWGKELIAASRGRVCGWLNWAFADTPESTDLTRWSGCWTTDLILKPWGEFFSAFARDQAGAPDPPRPWPTGMREQLKGADKMKLSPEAGNQTRLSFRAVATQ